MLHIRREQLTTPSGGSVLPFDVRPAKPVTQLDERDRQTGGRLSRPAAEVLVQTVADSLADRMSAVAGPPPNGATLAGMADADRLELARHALNAALEALDSEPVLAADLLPSTTSGIRARIARGCTADREMRAVGFVVAEIDIVVWEQLIGADDRTVPAATLESTEAADRRRIVLDELGIDENDLDRYRNDLRVVRALVDLDRASN